jgi:hypothetical protein
MLAAAHREEARLSRPWPWLAAWTLLLPLVGTADAAGRVETGNALSPRNANYTIEVTLDAESKQLHGHQIVEWRNIQTEPTGELWFHLYWNAWRNNRSSWLLEDRLRGRSALDDVRDEDWGYIEVDAVRLLRGDSEPPLELTDRMSFAAPDDANPDDRTVAVLRLPQEVQPRASLRVELSWRAKIPRFFARTGYRGDYFFIAQWFPKLGVYEPEGWNCHQFHASTEFYSDYGVYDVRIEVPRDFVVGATGREIDRLDNSSGTVTHHYYQADVHDFAWTTSADYFVREARFDHPGLPPVEFRLLIRPEYARFTERYFAAARAALELFGSWYGPYPYGHLTIVDPAYGSDAGGMEYPTLITGGTRLFSPFGSDQPESVTVHEAGHQFWYGLVGNDEFEHAWLDEGLDTFSTLRALEVAFGDRLYVRRYLPPVGGGRGMFPLLLSDVRVPRFVDRLNRYRRSARDEDPRTPSFLYHPGAAGDISYNKTALWLATLERHLGWETLRAILSTFFERYSFAHPAPEDFFAVANEVSGQDLTWFFDQVFRDSVGFDYAIGSVETFPVTLEGFDEIDGELRLLDPDSDDPELYRNEVVVRRKGDGRFPVEVLLVFEDGSELRETWDGAQRWKLFVEERSSKLDHAVVDPERVLLLDVDYTNNSRLVDRRDRLPARKWASRWMLWLQDFFTTIAFFV